MLGVTTRRLDGQAGSYGFVPLPAPLMLTMLGLTAFYVLVTEIAKRVFYSRLENAIAKTR